MYMKIKELKLLIKEETKKVMKKYAYIVRYYQHNLEKYDKFDYENQARERFEQLKDDDYKSKYKIRGPISLYSCDLIDNDWTVD